MTWVPNGVTIIKYVGRMYNHGQNKFLATLNRGNIIIIALMLVVVVVCIDIYMYICYFVPFAVYGYFIIIILRRKDSFFILKEEGLPRF